MSDRLSIPESRGFMPNVSQVLAESVIVLNSPLAQDASLFRALERIAQVACTAPIGSDEAAVTLGLKGHPEVVVVQGPASFALEQAQLEAQSGPGIDALRNKRVTFVDPISSTLQRWPAFAQAAAEHSVTRSLSLPLTCDETSVGALTMYGMNEAQFNRRELDRAQRFSQLVSTAIGNVHTYWRSVEVGENLSIALETRDLIGQAKGILMATGSINADQAFALLRSASQHLNRKLRDIALEVTLTGRLPRDPEQHTEAL